MEISEALKIIKELRQNELGWVNLIPSKLGSKRIEALDLIIERTESHEKNIHNSERVRK